MKQSLLGLMTLLMLTPVLVCGMAFCPMQAAQAAEMTCHQSDDNSGVMLNLDCMGIDLFQQDTSNDIQPDLSVDYVDYAWAELAAGYNFQPDNIHGIRGPPDRVIDPQSQPSIILTTQRLRI